MTVYAVGQDTYCPNIYTEGNVVYNNETHYTEMADGIIMSIKIYDRNQVNIMQFQSDPTVARCEVKRIELTLPNRLAQSFRD